MVKKTINEVIKFLETVKSGTIKRSGLIHISHALRSSLQNKVFTNYLSNIYSIEDMDELISLIKGDTHIRRGTYNAAYKRYIKLRKYPNPHEITGQLKGSVNITVGNDEVIFQIPESATTKRGGNYGPIHERRKSVIKSTVYFAWPNIKQKIHDLYERFIENA